jgi:hypothetical protein
MRALIPLILICFSSSAALSQPKGVLHTDSFIRGSGGLPTGISVVYVPDNPANLAKAMMFVASSSDVTAKPAHLELQPNVAASVELQFHTMDFAEESVTVQSACCPSVKVVIEPGANHQLMISTPADVSDRDVFAVTVSANDAEGKALKCRESLEVYLAPAGGQIRGDESKPWEQSATTRVGPGNVLAARFQVRPAALLGGHGDLNAQLRTPEGVVLLSKTTTFAIATSPAVNFIATIVGALLWTLVRISATKPREGTTRLSGRTADFLTAALSGVVAFFLALGLEKADLGVAVDRTRPWGFAVLGLLISFGGAENFLRRSSKGDAAKEPESPAGAGTDVVAALSDLRRTFNKNVLGINVDDPNSLYSFVERHVNPLYAGTHREAESVVMTCRRAGEEAEFDVLIDTTLTPPAIARTIEPIKIWYQEPLLPGVTDKTQGRQRQLVNLTFDLVGCHYASNTERTELVRQTVPGKGHEDFPASIPIDVEITGKSIKFEYALEVPESLRKGPFGFKARTVWRRPTDADFFTWTVFRPTRVFNFDCHFPDDVLVQVDSFSLTSAASSSDSLLPEPTYGSAHVSMRDWLLPGHGVVIIWASLVDPKSAQ